jgi:hypothetical protein
MPRRGRRSCQGRNGWSSFAARSSQGHSELVQRLFRGRDVMAAVRLNGVPASADTNRRRGRSFVRKLPCVPIAPCPRLPPPAKSASMSVSLSQDACLVPSSVSNLQIPVLFHRQDYVLRMPGTRAVGGSRGTVVRSSVHSHRRFRRRHSSRHWQGVRPCVQTTK